MSLEFDFKKIKETPELIELKEESKIVRQKIREVKVEQERRFKAIISDAVLMAVERNALSKKSLEHILHTYVTEKADREFLNLPPLDEPESVTNSDNAMPVPVNQEQPRHNEQNGHHQQPEHQYN